MKDDAHQKNAGWELGFTLKNLKANLALVIVLKGYFLGNKWKAVY